jgi:diadenosine tetraphosphate (Ap4A) HIT family hydrolase
VSESGDAADCHICTRVAGDEGVVRRSASFTAFALADRPGWIMYATTRHGDWLWGLTDQEAEEMGPFVRRLAGAIRDAAGTSHVYYVGLGENSLHFHGILAARYEPFAKDIQAALAQRGNEMADAADAQRVIDRLRNALQTRSGS